MFGAQPKLFWCMTESPAQGFEFNLWKFSALAQLQSVCSLLSCISRRSKPCQITHEAQTLSHIISVRLTRAHTMESMLVLCFPTSPILALRGLKIAEPSQTLNSTGRQYKLWHKSCWYKVGLSVYFSKFRLMIWIRSWAVFCVMWTQWGFWFGFACGLFLFLFSMEFTLLDQIMMLFNEERHSESRNRMVIKPYRMINSLINYCS